MLPTSPVSFFNEEELVFKEISELNAIGDALFADFLYENNIKPRNKFLNDLDLNSLLKMLKTDLADENVWLVYFKHEIVGFWFLKEQEGKLVINFYFAPEFNWSPLESFFIGFCKTLDELTQTTVYVNVSHLNDNQKGTYLGSTEVDDIVPGEVLKTKYIPDEFTHLIEKITPYYE